MKPQEFEKALKTLSKIVEASLGKRLVISIE
jgi:hypothetical protein